MIEELVKSFYDSIVDENLRLYEDIFNTTEITQNTDEYWKQAIGLYNRLDEEQKATLLLIVKQTMIDTISNVLGVIDGSSTLNDYDGSLKLLADNEEVSGELQDHFLAYIEEN